MDKIFDLELVKKQKPQVKPVEKQPTSASLHVRYFDWHTLSYLLYALAAVLGIAAAVLVTRLITLKKIQPKTAKPLEEKIITPPQTEAPSAPSPDSTQTAVNPFEPPPSNETKTPEIDKKTVKIRVLNGNGATGDAAKAKSQLEAADFTVDKIGNAARQDYGQTQVYYLAQKKDQANLVADALKTAGRTVNIEEAGADLVGKTFEVLVVVGRK